MGISKLKTLPVASVVVTLLVLFYKRPDAFINPQFYAEEGIYFFSDAYHYGFKSVFNTCAGYFHLYPRLVFCAALALDIPLVYMPFVCTYSWLLMQMFVLLYVWRRIELDATKKFFLVIAMSLIPLQAEILMNLTNVQWIMALLPVIIFTSTDEDQNKKWFWADAIMLVLVGFTGPNLLVLSPLLICLIIMKRSTRPINPGRWCLIFMVALAVVVSLFTLLSYGRIERSEGIFSITNPAFAEYLYLQYAPLFLGWMAFDTPMILKYVFLLTILGYAIYVVYRIFKNKESNRFTIGVFFAGLLFLLATLISYRNNPAILHPHYGGTRNFFLPAICCIWYFISSIKPANNPVAVISLLMLLFACENLRVIGRERLIDYHWAAYAKQVDKRDTLTIPVNPQGWRLFIDNRIVGRNVNH